VLVVVDYLQIVESKEGDPRSKVADVVAQIDELLRAYRCVGILISQMSRNASRESKNGDRVGADTTDGGKATRPGCPSTAARPRTMSSCW
jgi:replicative DNA helicase